MLFCLCLFYEKETFFKSLIKYQCYLVSVIDLLAGASRSTTPLSLLSRNKSPSADMAVQVNQQQNVGNRDAGHKRQPNQQQPISRGTYNRERHDSGRGNNDYSHNQYDNRNQYQQRNNNNQQNRGGWMNRNNNMNMNNMRNPNNRGRGNGGPPRMSNQVSLLFMFSFCFL